MPTSIKQIRKENQEIIESTLDIKVYKKINENFYIVVDENAHALLESSQELLENIVYKLLKPKFVNSILYANPKLKILKTKLKLEGKSLTKNEVKQYEETVTSFAPKQDIKQKKNLNNFSKCEALNENDKIDMLTVLIISKSRDIEGKFGNYNIVTAKDCEGKKNSLNIYHDKAKIVQPQKLLTFTTLKKTPYKPDDVEFHRLATIWNTRIFEAKETEKIEFKDILMGDEKCTVVVLGFDDMNVYESCQQCYSKLLEEFCKKCQKHVEGKKTNDFYVTLYAQDVQNEAKIIDLFAFKKDLQIMNGETEDFDKKLEEISGQTFTIEYNKPEGNEKCKLVKLYKN